MNTVTAHGLICTQLGEVADLLEDVEVSAVPGLDPRPALLTAAARLSGGLEDAATWGDVLECLKHFLSLLGGGIVGPEEWEQEAHGVIADMVRWGDGVAMACMGVERN